MKNSFKLFDFKGTPVYLKYWFFILLLLGVNTFVTLFIAVLIHELAHAYMAKRLNHPVDYIYLDAFNGAAMIDTTYSSCKDTILITIVGPISNLLLYGVGYFLLNSGFENYTLNSFLSVFCNINMILFIFNMLPIYPMDGGRISKAICQYFTKPSIGRKINGYISIITSLLLLVFSLFSNMIILAIFCIFFIYIGYTEIKQKY